MAWRQLSVCRLSSEVNLKVDASLVNESRVDALHLPCLRGETWGTLVFYGAREQQVSTTVG